MFRLPVEVRRQDDKIMIKPGRLCWQFCDAVLFVLSFGGNQMKKCEVHGKELREKDRFGYIKPTLTLR